MKFEDDVKLAINKIVDILEEMQKNLTYFLERIVSLENRVKKLEEK